MMEKWDVYDAAGKPTGRVKTRADEFAPGEYHLGASLWLVNSRGEVLIQKRAKTKFIGPGKWSITGGAVRAGETSRAGCVREVAEEIGLEVRPEEIALLSRSFGKEIIFDDYILVLDVPLDGLTLQTEEVDEVRWAPMEEVFRLFEAGEFLMDSRADIEKVCAHIEAHIARPLR
jgi:8-oxo-dGTP pyrophosphatase MutT (NUDIX family)